AEDPDRNFMPSPGTIGEYEEPSGEGVRVDSGGAANFEISRAYDPLVAKLVTHGDHRQHAVDRMVEALNNYTIGDLTTNIDMHLDVLQSEAFLEGEVDTNWLEGRY
ncbi:MAG: hypothetical protein ABEL76_04140, partial [Bradymonadaceae bacterium]